MRWRRPASFRTDRSPGLVSAAMGVPLKPGEGLIFAVKLFLFARAIDGVLLGCMGSLLRGVLSCSTGPDRERCEVSDGVGDGVEPRGVKEVEVVLGSGELRVGDRLLGDRAEPVGEPAGVLDQHQGVEGAVDDQERRGLGVDVGVRGGGLRVWLSGVAVVAVEADDATDLCARTARRSRPGARPRSHRPRIWCRDHRRSFDAFARAHARAARASAS